MLLNQRERLFAATVAVVAEKGYEATRVEDILVKAGVSRNAFYKQFANKRECFLAALDEIAALAKPSVFDVFEQTAGTWDEKLRAMLDAFAAVIVAQPAMARVGWVEVYAAGPEAVEIADRIDRSIENIVCRALTYSPERAGMPREIVGAIVGGVRKIVHTRVREERTHELPGLMPELFAWMQSYHTPPERLRRPRRVPPEFTALPQEPTDPRERIMRAVTELVAEEGYPAMAITEIAARASVSLTTFYAHFDGKESAFLATLADAQRQLFEATVPHFLSGADWPTSVSLGARAFLGFLSTNRAMAMLGGFGVWATSPAALELRAQGVALFETLLNEGYRCYPETSPIAAEGIGASLDALLFKSLQSAGPARLYELGPTATFIVLAPFVGAGRAFELANQTSAGVA
ncbi:MAG TPA: TetR/AcrR family transcriptional regulator [Thermoleophilaceae bacterium]|nr:TetR/AcrR family transcriptional regulator [Thermoleophilaceae bacterium]